MHLIWEFYQIKIGMSKLREEPITETIDITFDTIFAIIGYYLSQN